MAGQTIDTLQVRLFGTPEIRVGGMRIDVQTRKALALLAYLGVTQRPHGREAIAALLWPEYPQARATANLRSTLWSLRKAVGAETVAVEQDQLRVTEALLSAIDVVLFRRHVAAARAHPHQPGASCPSCLAALLAAADAGGGEFLAGFALDDSPPFDDWRFFETENLRQEQSWVLERLVNELLGRGDFERASTYARTWLTLDPLHEPIHRQLMLLHSWSNHRAAAFRQYQECVRILDYELGVAPMDETTELYHAIREGNAPPPPTSAAPISAPAVPSRPVRQRRAGRGQSTAFIGRRRELALIDERLCQTEGCRAVTLLGMGGAGKTRLALQAADVLHASFTDGTAIVELADVTTPEVMVTTIADAVGCALQGGTDPLPQLLGFLAAKELLLVLDNLEQLPEAGEVLALILEQAPDVKLLATSRRRLGLSEEWVVEIEGLGLPERGAAADGAQSEAVQLFVQSAQRMSAAFALRPELLPDMVEICQLVEGMPLGIELAAAWVRTLSCAEIAAEIAQNLDLLRTEHPDAPARHTSLRAVFLGSWELLADGERRGLAALSIFRGGFLRAAASAVATASLALLSTLIDKSLLYRHGGGRYMLHPAIRQYASEQLAALRIDADALAHRHIEHYLALAEQAEQALLTAQHPAWLERIEREHDNFRAALGWSLGEGRDIPLGLRLTAALAIFWQHRGHIDEGRHWLSTALEAAETATITPQLHARLLNSASVYARLRGQFERALELQQHGLKLARLSGDSGLIGAALNNQGVTLLKQGRYQEVGPFFEESLALYRERGDQSRMAGVLSNLGTVAALANHDFQRARHYFEEALAMHRATGYTRGVATALNNLATLAGEEHDFERSLPLHMEALNLRRTLGDQLEIAQSLHNVANNNWFFGNYAQTMLFGQEALEITRQLGDRRLSTLTLILLGDTACAERDVPAALTAFREALSLAREIRFMPGLCSAVEGVAHSAALQGQPALGALLLGTADTLRANQGIKLVPLNQLRRDRIAAAIAESMEPAEYEATREAGGRMTLEQALDLPQVQQLLEN